MAQSLAHHIQLLLQENQDGSLLKTDVSNAFNTASRKHLLSEASGHFPELYHHVCQMYGSSSSLIYAHGNDITTLNPEEGVNQEDPLGPFLFAAALHPTLKSLQKKYEGLSILAYLDDLFMLDLSPISNTFCLISNSLQELGLLICDKKCELYNPSKSVTTFGSIPLVSNGTEILGIPIETQCYVQSACYKTAQKGSALCSELVQLECRQSALLLLCFVSTF